ncbi:hypothetical protein E2C01_000273 [Portunus trituberculatus]|uniref:Uncharacterized protein n=1 Tax=Portunus trituberculatus TaxID=210409 RepID=A0A5B7CEP8_PORTR|nr:hypothetical protein [Portunus trituberculatus]
MLNLSKRQDYEGRAKTNKAEGSGEELGIIFHILTSITTITITTHHTSPQPQQPHHHHHLSLARGLSDGRLAVVGWGDAEASLTARRQRVRDPVLRYSVLVAMKPLPPPIGQT